MRKGDHSTASGKPTSVLLRDVDRAVLDVFRARAERNGRSLQAELQLSLRREARRNFDEALLVSGLWQRALAGRKKPAGMTISAKELIAEDRRR